MSSASEAREWLEELSAAGAVAIQLLHRLFASEPQHPPDPSPARLAIVGL